MSLREIFNLLRKGFLQADGEIAAASTEVVPPPLSPLNEETAMSKAAKFIDRINEWVGKWVSYLVVPLTVIVVYEVIMRYLFDAPTLWAWDVNMYLGGLMTILGAGYAHLHKSHVSVDFLLEKWSPQKRVLLDLILSPLIILPLAILAWYGFEAAWQSVKINEHHSSLWEPPIYPLRIAIPIGAVLFLLQAVSRFIGDILHYRDVKGEEGGN
jgi:TRAP-type mannitol/chloroaromatic compound transport system permease small subunit